VLLLLLAILHRCSHLLSPLRPLLLLLLWGKKRLLLGPLQHLLVKLLLLLRF
jgi:hypothetical protein